MAGMTRLPKGMNQAPMAQPGLSAPGRPNASLFLAARHIQNTNRPPTPIIVTKKTDVPLKKASTASSASATADGPTRSASSRAVRMRTAR